MLNEVNSKLLEDCEIVRLTIGVFKKQKKKVNKEGLKVTLADIGIYCKAFADKYLRNLDVELGELLLRSYIGSIIVFEGLDGCFLRSVGYQPDDTKIYHLSENDLEFLLHLITEEISHSVNPSVILYDEDDYALSDIYTRFTFNGVDITLENETALLTFNNIEYYFPKEVIYFLNDIDEADEDEIITILLGGVLFKLYGLSTPTDIKVGFEVTI